MILAVTEAHYAFGVMGVILTNLVWLFLWRRTVTRLLQAYEDVRRTGQLNELECVGAERFLNLALAARKKSCRFPPRRLEPAGPHVNLNIDRLLVVEHGRAEPLPTPVTVEVIPQRVAPTKALPAKR